MGVTFVEKERLHLMLKRQWFTNTSMAVVSVVGCTNHSHSMLTIECFFLDINFHLTRCYWISLPKKKQGNDETQINFQHLLSSRNRFLPLPVSIQTCPVCLPMPKRCFHWDFFNELQCAVLSMPVCILRVSKLWWVVHLWQLASHSLALLWQSSDDKQNYSKSLPYHTSLMS